MAKITIGTTPTIRFTGFTVCTPSDIVSAILTVTQVGANGASQNVIERDETTMTRGEDYIEWTLTQAETLKLRTTGSAQRCSRAAVDKPSIVANFLTSDGTRGVTNTLTVEVADNPISEVMS